MSPGIVTAETDCYTGFHGPGHSRLAECDVRPPTEPTGSPAVLGGHAVPSAPSTQSSSAPIGVLGEPVSVSGCRHDGSLRSHLRADEGPPVRSRGVVAALPGAVTVAEEARAQRGRAAHTQGRISPGSPGPRGLRQVPASFRLGHWTLLSVSATRKMSGRAKERTPRRGAPGDAA